MEEESLRNLGGRIMEMGFWWRNNGDGIILGGLLEGESWSRNRGGGIMAVESWRWNLEEESWRKDHGGILEMESWARNHFWRNLVRGILEKES